MRPSVFVTGASGFVGRDLIVRLSHQRFDVRAAARDPASLPEQTGIERVTMPDLLRTFDWRPLLAGVTHVVHLAGIAHATEEIASGNYTAVNAEATRSLAAAARNSGVRRVVLLSSVRAQSGPVADAVLSEADRPQPTDAYGRSKLFAEQFLAETLAGSDTDFCVLRPVLIYGPGVKGNLRALVRLARRRLPLPFGGLTNRRSILGLPNLAGAVVHALTADSASRRTFLVADPEPATIADIVSAQRQAEGRRPCLVALPGGAARALATLAGKQAAWDRLAGSLVVDTSALAASGWQASETTAEGLARWMRLEATVPVWERAAAAPSGH